MPVRRYCPVVAIFFCLSAPTRGEVLPEALVGESGLNLRGRLDSPPWPLRHRHGVVLDGRRSGLNESALLRSSEIDFRGGRTPQPVGAGLPVTVWELKRLGFRPRGRGLTDLSLWPDEPVAPQEIDHGRFSAALVKLCPMDTQPAALTRYAGWVLRYSGEYGVDPFVLAALIFYGSRCQAARQHSFGVGLTLINPGMYRAGFGERRYHYWVHRHGLWRAKFVRAEAFPFNREILRNPQANIYFAAALLRTHMDQFPGSKHWFDSISHRHAVSHFVWGDWVRDTGPEDLILLARRRLIAYYRQVRRQRSNVRFRGVAFSCPLDGHPRRITSGLGEPRENGRRKHKGVDFLSSFGEPVRALADGIITLAGADLRDERLVNWNSRLTGVIQPSALGPRGLFVTIQHSQGVTSLYAHLAAFVVKKGQKIKRGNLIGYVGRTGMKFSAAHLHLGLFHNNDVLDPTVVLGAYVLGPEKTILYRRKLRSLSNGSGMPTAVAR